MTAPALVPQPAPKPVPDDIWLMVCLWQRPHTREVALDLADANRRALRNAAADAFMDAHLGKDME
jgi:hypothetical protein